VQQVGTAYQDVGERLARHLRWHYRSVDLGDLEVTEVPGYWRRKTPCGGQGKCRSPLHGCTGNEGPVHHTVRFLDPDRGLSGRFTSPYRTWQAFRERAEAEA
jgi:hypothetical protein